MALAAEGGDSRVAVALRATMDRGRALALHRLTECDGYRFAPNSTQRIYFGKTTFMTRGTHGRGVHGDLFEGTL